MKYSLKSWRGWESVGPPLNGLKATYRKENNLNKISDHFPILLFRHSSEKKVKAKEFSSRDFSDSNVNKFKQALQNFNWNFVEDNNDAQVAFSNFSNVFHNLYNLYLPIVVKNSRKTFTILKNG